MGLKHGETTLASDEGLPQLTVKTQQLQVMPSLKLSTRLGKLIAPSLAKAEGAIESDAEDLSALAPAFAEFFTQLDEKQIDSLVLQVFASTQVQYAHPERGEIIVSLGTLQNVNTAFEGRLDDLLRALWFVLEHNYSGFISAALQRLKARAAAKKAEAEARAAALKAKADAQSI